jgi:hypothetical protein
MNRRTALTKAGAGVLGIGHQPVAFLPSTRWRGDVVSLVQLLATPEKYDGSLVRVVGFVHLEFEGDALYLHREDFERMLLSNSLDLSLSDEQARQWKELSDRYVGVQATFEARTRGTRAFRPGRLKAIVRFEYHPSRDEFLASMPGARRP